MRRRIVTDKSPNAARCTAQHRHLLAAAVTNLFPARSAASVRRTTKVFLRLRRPAPFVPEDLEAIEAMMQELAAQDLVYERQMWPRDEATAFFEQRGEPLKMQLIDEKTEARRSLRLHHQGQGHLRRLLRRPARPDHRQAEGVQAAHHLERVLEGRRAQPADAARLRHRVPVREGSEGAPDADRRGEEARPPQARRELGLFTFHQWAPGARSGSDKGTTLYNTLANYMRERAVPAGYVEVKTPLVYNKALWETSGHWAHYRRTCSSSSPKARRWHEADELPGPLPALREPDAQLSRSADPLSRADAAAPQRSVRRAVGLTRVRQFSQDDATAS
jgi:threonyl-tRNA synthetase